MRARAISAVALLAVLALLCGGSGCGRVDETADRNAPSVVERSSPGKAKRPATETVAPSRCPSGLHGCRSVAGRIVYVERVDPDGDGDAHFVVIDSQGITLPWLTSIDVRRGLRPHPLPGPGGLISAAGPIETGSYGQHQIHAVELHVGHRR